MPGEIEVQSLQYRIGMGAVGFLRGVGQVLGGLRQIGEGVQAQQRRFNEFADRSVRSLDRVSQATRRAQLAIVAMTTALTVAMGAASAAGIQLNAHMEQAEIGFETMLGSAKAAKDFLADLARFAARTPFEFRGLVSSSQRLLAFGFQAKEILPTLDAVGDAAAALGGGPDLINQIVRALGQIKAKGKPQAEEMLQLAEAGIPSWQILAEMLGVTIPEAMEMVTRGAVDADTAVNALVRGLAVRYGGMMERQSRTLIGLWSTIRDTIELTLGRATRSLFDGLKELAEVVAEFTASSEFERWAQGVSDALAVAVGWIKDGVRWFQLLDDEQRAQITRWALLVPAVLAGVAALGLVASVASVVLRAMMLIGAAIAIATSPWVIGTALLVAAATALWTAWDQDWGGLRSRIEEWSEKALEAFKSVADWWDKSALGKRIREAWAEVKEIWDSDELTLGEKTIETAKVVVNALVDVAQIAWEAGKDLASRVWEWIKKQLGVEVDHEVGASRAEIVLGEIAAVLDALVRLVFGASPDELRTQFKNWVESQDWAAIMAGIGTTVILAVAALQWAGLTASMIASAFESAWLAARIGFVGATQTLTLGLTLGGLTLALSLIWFSFSEEAKQSIRAEVDKLRDRIVETWVKDPLRLPIEIFIAVPEAVRNIAEITADELFKDAPLLTPEQEQAIKENAQRFREGFIAFLRGPAAFWEFLQGSREDRISRDVTKVIDAIIAGNPHLEQFRDRLTEIARGFVDIAEAKGAPLTLQELAELMALVLSESSTVLNDMEAMQNPARVTAEGFAELTRQGIELSNTTEGLARNLEAALELFRLYKREFGGDPALAAGAFLFPSFARRGEFDRPYLGPGDVQDLTVNEKARRYEEILKSFTGLNEGGIVPPGGRGDWFPALLASDEAVIPGSVWKKGIVAVAAWFRKMGAPGYQTGALAGVPADLRGQIEAERANLSGLERALHGMMQTFVGGMMRLIDLLVTVLEAIGRGLLGEERFEQFQGAIRSARSKVEEFMNALTGATMATEGASDGLDRYRALIESRTRRTPEDLRTWWEKSFDWIAARFREWWVQFDDEGKLVGGFKKDLQDTGQQLLALANPLNWVTLLFEKLGLVSAILEGFFGALAPIIELLQEPLRIIGEILAELFAPILVALMPILKLFATVVSYVAEIIANAWNALASAINAVLGWLGVNIKKMDVGAIRSARERIGDLPNDIDPNRRSGGTGGTRAAPAFAELAGPARDLLKELLRPLVNLNTWTGYFERGLALLTDIKANTAAMAASLVQIPTDGVLAAAAAAGGASAPVTIVFDVSRLNDPGYAEERIELLSRALGRKVKVEKRTRSDR